MFDKNCLPASAIIAAVFLCALAIPRDVSAQVYRWVDKNGEVHFSNDPYEAKRKSGDTATEVGKAEKPSAKPAPKSEQDVTSSEADTETNGEATTDETASETKPAEEKGSVKLIGDIEFVPSISGRALVKATIQNNSKLPVRDVGLDLFVFKKNTERLDYSIPFTDGKTRPDRLTPGEEGTIEYEIDLAPEEVFAYKYRLRWREFEVVAPPAEGQPTPEGVIHKVIKREQPTAAESQK